MDARPGTAPTTIDDLPLPFLEVQPWDEHNRELVEHVRPPAWRNPQATGRYNLVVIGGGTAGLVTAAGAARLGARVALVERELMGGDCLNAGCVPSKTLLRAAQAVVQVREARALGVKVPERVEVDFAAVMERVRAVRARLAPRDSAHRFQELGVDVFLGNARFTGRDTVRVGDQTLRFSRACVATGSRPLAPPVFGLATSGFLTTQSVFSLTSLPGRLAVLGGGASGCELAQAFARLGAQVTLLEAGPRLLAREDPDVAAVIEAALRHDGVDVRLGVRVGRVERRDAERVLTFSDEGQPPLRVDEVLVCTGRRPNVDDLQLDAAGVDYDERGGIRVDDRLRTTNRDIYAAGDCCTADRFTHVADAMARIVVRNALLFGRETTRDLAIPWVTFTDPEVAHVGLTAREAAEQGLLVQTLRVDLGDLDRPVIDADPAGFLAVHLERGSDRLLGATLVGRRAGEALGELSVAVQTRLSLSTLGKVIHAYPTRAEAVRRAADVLLQQRGASIVVRTLLRGLMALRR